MGFVYYQAGNFRIIFLHQTTRGGQVVVEEVGRRTLRRRRMPLLHMEGRT